MQNILPTRIKQIQIQPETKKLILADGVLPPLASNQVVISVEAIGVNKLDWLQRHGYYPVPATDSPILGVEVAGTVIAVGNDSLRHWLGKSVCSLVPGGGYATHVLADAGLLIPKPTGWSAIEAAALPEAALTIENTVHRLGELKKGNHILVHGGASGIGSFAIKQLSTMGYQVSTTVGTEDKKKACLELGASHVINYQTEDFLTRLQAVLPPPKVILDMVAGDYTAKHIDLLAKDGHLILIAFQGGRSSEIDMAKVLGKRLTIHGTTLRSMSLNHKRNLVASFIQHNQFLLEQRQVTPTIGGTYTLAQAEEAHQAMQAHHYVGKLILTNDGKA